MYLEVKEITVTKEMLSKKENITDKYPNSGLFLVKNEELGMTDFAFVDKENDIHLMLCPLNIFARLEQCNLPVKQDIQVETITDVNQDFLNGIIDGFLDGTYINSKLIEKLKS